MSLVDYAASSDEEEPERLVDDEDKDVEQLKQNSSKRPRFGVSAPNQPSEALPEENQLNSSQRISMKSTTSSQKTAMNPDHSSVPKLPDASLLLNSPMLPSNLLRTSDHFSWVAATMAENESVEGNSSESGARFPQKKLSKGHLKSVPNTVGGRLLPPQLTGRSNIVTEDISKLFVRKHVDS